MTYSIHISPVPLQSLPQVAALLIRLAGSLSQAEAMRVARSGGVVARNLNREAAEAIATGLRRIGVDVQVIREVRDDRPPVPDPEPIPDPKPEPEPAPPSDPSDEPPGGDAGDGEGDAGDGPDGGGGVIPVGDPGSGGREEEYHVYGHLVNPAGEPLPGFTVRLFDRDLRLEEFLGSAITGAKGDYHIRYHKSAFERAESGGPDLVVRVWSPQGEALPVEVTGRELTRIGEDEVLFHAGNREHLPLRLLRDIVPPSRFEQIGLELEPLLGEADSAGLNAEEQRFLHFESGLPLPEISLWAEDHRLAAGHSMPAGVFFGLGMQKIGVGQWSEHTPLLIDPALLAQQSSGVLAEAIGRAVAEGISPAGLKGELEAIQSRLSRIVARYGDRHPEVQRKRLADAVRLSGLSEEKQRLVAQELLTENGSEPGAGSMTPVSIRSLADRELLGPEEAQRLATVLEVERLSGWREEVAAAALNATPGGRPVRRLRDLARLRQEEWREIFERQNGQSVVDPALLAAGTVRELTMRYPTAALTARRIDRDYSPVLQSVSRLKPILEHAPGLFSRLLDGEALPAVMDGGRPGAEDRELVSQLATLAGTFRHMEMAELLDDDRMEQGQKVAELSARLEAVRKLFEQNPEVELRDVDFFAVDEEQSGLDLSGIDERYRPMVRRQAMACHRTLHLAPDVECAERLLACGLDTTGRILSMAPDVLADRAGISVTVARQVYRRAEALALAARQLGMQVAADHQEAGAVPAVLQATSGSGQVLRRLDGYEELFGVQNYCTCRHCASIFGPVAYFVDLMRFTGKHILEPFYGRGISAPGPWPALHLRSRRPDLWRLKLDCDSATRLVPALTIVNEILEDAVTPEYGEDTREERASLAYERLEQAEGSFRLPFHRPLAELRIYLQQRGSDLAGLLAELVGESPRTTGEQLSLSPAQAALILGADSDEEAIRTRYGLKEDDLIGRMRVTELSRLSGLGREEISRLVSLSVIDPEGGLSIVTEPIPGTDNRFEEELTGLTLSHLDRIHRFVRLAGHCGWPLETLADLLHHDASAIFAENSDEEQRADALARLAAIHRLCRSARLQPEMVIAMSGRIPESPLGPEGASLFDRLFNEGLSMGDSAWWDGAMTVDWYWSPADPGAGGPGNEQIYQRLLHALSISEDRFQGLISSLFADLRNEEGEFAVSLNRERLARMVRHVWLMRHLELEAEDVARLLELVSGPDETGPEGIRLLERIFGLQSHLQQIGISLSQLLGALSGEGLQEGFPEALLSLATPEPEQRQFVSENGELFGFAPGGEPAYRVLIRLIRYAGFAKDPATRPLLHSILKGEVADAEALAEWFSESSGLMESYLTHLPMPGDEPASGDTPLALKRLACLDSAVRAGRRLGVNGQTVAALLSDRYEVLDRALRRVVAALRSSYEDEESFEKAYRSSQDKIRELRRDALTDYLLTRPELSFRSLRDLYHHYLVDTQAAGCMDTSRVVQATKSVQLYLHRAMLGLEVAAAGSDQPVRITPSEEMRQEWEWRREYRIWEANRKVFVYPENLLDPDIRLDKLPLFRQAEEMISQQEISRESVERAYRFYLEELRELSQLTVSGGCYDKDGQRYWLVGKGSGKAASWYLRSADYVGPAAGWKSILYDSKRPLDWSVWEKVDLQIHARSLSPFVWRNRLHLCWIEREERKRTSVSQGTPSDEGTEHVVNLHIAWRREDGSWSDITEIGLETFHRPRHQQIDERDERQSYVDWRVFPEVRGSRLYVEHLLWNGTQSRVHLSEIDLFSATAQPLNSHQRDQFRQGFEPSSCLRVFDFNTSRNEYNLFAAMQDYEGDLQLEYPDLRSNRPVSQHNQLPNGAIWLTDSTRRDFFTGSNYARSESFIHSIHGSPGSALVRLKDDVYLLEPQINLLLLLPLPYWRAWPLTNRRAGEMGSRLMAEGIDRFLKDREEPGRETFPIAPASDKLLQVQQALQSGGTDHRYERELSLHLPHLIARQLSAAGRYEEAQQWYHTLFDPTTDREPPSQQEIDEGVSPAAHYWADPALRRSPRYPEASLLESEAAIEQYRRHPFNPHAVASVRIRAYQKAIVMDYVNNLIDWADSLFARDTRESINEASMLYTLASEVLGPQPRRLGSCDSMESDRGATTLGDLVVEGEFDVTMETLVLSATVSEQEAVTDVPGGQEVLLGDWEVPAAGLMVRDSGASLSVEDGDTVGSHPFQGLMAGGVSGNTAGGRLSAATILPHSREAFCLPANEQMLGLWNRVEDRLYKIRNCMDLEGNVRSLALFAPPLDPAMMARAAAAGLDPRQIADSGSGQVPVYRFVALIARAKQASAIVQGFGAALLSALEKRDAEELRLLQATHSQDILALNEEIRTRQIRMEEEALEALRISKEMARLRHDHYEQLIEGGLSGFEKLNISFMTQAQMFESMSNSANIMASVSHAIPQVGSPFAMTYGGREIGAIFSALGGAFQSMAGNTRFAATLTSTMGSYQRREEEWSFQKRLAANELEQFDIRIRAAEDRIQVAGRQLRIHRESVEQAREQYEFYRDKFTSLGLYRWLSSELSRLCHFSYELALELARMAESAYRYEREDSSPYITTGHWDSGRAGLLAGERLSVQLHRLEKAYMDRNERRLEIDQTFALGQLDPLALNSLREEGLCEFSLPEVLFDVAYPGQYNRRIRSVRVTIPCLTGPYTNVNARLTLLESHVRPQPEVDAPDAPGLEPRPLSGQLSIATSSAQSDGGLFELNFHDERYLPFEGAGAVSRWRLEFPSRLRLFDYDTISDVLIHIGYTARENDAYRQQVESGLEGLLNAQAGSGGIPRALYLGEEFSAHFRQLLRSVPESGAGMSRVVIDLDDRHFPYFMKGRRLRLAEAGFLLRIAEPWQAGLESPDAGPLKVDVRLARVAGDGEAEFFAPLAIGGSGELPTRHLAAPAQSGSGDFLWSGADRWEVGLDHGQLVALCEKLAEVRGEDAGAFGSPQRMVAEMVEDLGLFLQVRIEE